MKILLTHPALKVKSSEDEVIRAHPAYAHGPDTLGFNMRLKQGLFQLPPTNRTG